LAQVWRPAPDKAAFISENKILQSLNPVNPDSDKKRFERFNKFEKFGSTEQQANSHLSEL
jgi:hypothetical protein